MERAFSVPSCLLVQNLRHLEIPLTQTRAHGLAGQDSIRTAQALAHSALLSSVELESGWEGAQKLRMLCVWIALAPPIHASTAQEDRVHTDACGSVMLGTSETQTRALNAHALRVV